MESYILGCFPIIIVTGQLKFNRNFVSGSCEAFIFIKSTRIKGVTVDNAGLCPESYPNIPQSWNRTESPKTLLAGGRMSGKDMSAGFGTGSICNYIHLE